MLSVWRRSRTVFLASIQGGRTHYTTSMLLTMKELRVKYTQRPVFPPNSMPQPILSLTVHLWSAIVVVLFSPQEKLKINIYCKKATWQQNRKSNFKLRNGTSFKELTEVGKFIFTTKYHLSSLFEYKNKLTFPLLPGSRQEQYNVLSCADNHVGPKQWKHHFHHAMQRFLWTTQVTIICINNKNSSSV